MRVSCTVAAYAAACRKAGRVQREHKNHRTSSHMWTYRPEGDQKWMGETTVQRVRGFKAFTGAGLLQHGSVCRLQPAPGAVLCWSLLSSAHGASWVEANELLVAAILSLFARYSSPQAHVGKLPGTRKAADISRLKAVAIGPGPFTIF